MSDLTPRADTPADTTDSDAPVTTVNATHDTGTPEGAKTPQDDALAPAADVQTDAAPPYVIGDDTPITTSTPAAGADAFDSAAPAAPAEDDGEPAEAELPEVPAEPTEQDDTTSGTVFADPTAPVSDAPASDPIAPSTDSTTDSSTSVPDGTPSPDSSSPSTPSVFDSATDSSPTTPETPSVVASSSDAAGSQPVADGDVPPQATAVVPIAGPSTDGLPAHDDTPVPDPQPVNTGAIGSGEPVTDPGSPVVDPTAGDDFEDTGIATQVEDDGSPVGADSTVIPDAAYGGVFDGDEYPTAPDPSASNTPALPTETMPTAQDPASVRAPANGVPANAYIPPQREGEEPDPEKPADLGVGASVSPIQAQTSNVDDIVGDQAEQVGTPYDVYEIQRPTTSYIELVAELGLGISFLELAAFNQVVNQRYELYAGDKVAIPHQSIPGRIDGVKYDGDDQDDEPLADTNVPVQDRRDEFQNASSQFEQNKDDNA